MKSITKKHLEKRAIIKRNAQISRQEQAKAKEPKLPDLTPDDLKDFWGSGIESYDWEPVEIPIPEVEPAQLLELLTEAK